MPIYSFECIACDAVTDSLEPMGTKEIVCPECGAKARMIISSSKVNTANNDAAWVRSVLDVVDRGNKAPHVQEFVRNPTRETYRRWMKGEGIRPLESGEKPRSPVHFDTDRHAEKVMQMRMARKRIEVNAR